MNDKTADGALKEIVDDGIAVRLETRVRDGMSLEEASRLCLIEAKKRKRLYGWIAVDQHGNWAIAHTSNFMPFFAILRDRTFDPIQKRSTK